MLLRQGRKLKQPLTTWLNLTNVWLNLEVCAHHPPLDRSDEREENEGRNRRGHRGLFGRAPQPLEGSRVKAELGEEAAAMPPEAGGHGGLGGQEEHCTLKNVGWQALNNLGPFMRKYKQLIHFVRYRDMLCPTVIEKERDKSCILLAGKWNIILVATKCVILDGSVR